MATQPFADDKDWTWVLNSLCAECEFEVRDFAREEISALIRANAGEWLSILEGDDTTLRQRPRADRWSALEYAAHVRDVFDLYDYRLGLMLAEDGPHYPNWNQDDTALQKDYANSDPARVAVELAAAGERLTSRFETVSGEDWGRTGTAAMGLRSPLKASPAISSTTRCITCTMFEPVWLSSALAVGDAEPDSLEEGVR